MPTQGFEMVEEGHFALVVGAGAGAEEHGAAKIEGFMVSSSSCCSRQKVLATFAA
jgi:hypothetical protein